MAASARPRMRWWSELDNFGEPFLQGWHLKRRLSLPGFLSPTLRVVKAHHVIELYEALKAYQTYNPKVVGSNPTLATKDEEVGLS